MSLSKYSNYSSLVARLKKGIEKGALSHAYILEGDSLSGKESFAKDFAKAIVCAEKPGEGCDLCSLCRRIEGDNYEDFYVVRAQGNSVKDKQIQGLQSDLMNQPSGEARRNIAIIHNAETITIRAQNRLLKTLEEPKAETLIMLLTENSEMLLPTIRSRCSKLSLWGDEQVAGPAAGNAAGQTAGRAAGQAAAEEAKMEEMPELVESLLEMSDDGAYYYEMFQRLDKACKDRETAGRFLDALERKMRDVIVKGESHGMDKKSAKRSVKYIEEARRDLAYNVGVKSTLRNLLLKIGG